MLETPRPTAGPTRSTALSPGSRRVSTRLQRRVHVLFALTRADLRVRYGRGVWQVVKWLIDPFALVGVYVILRLILGRGGHATALNLACSVVPFQIVLLTFNSALLSVSAREPILLNMRFDRMLIPVGTVMTESLAFGTSFLMFPVTMVMYGIAPTPALLWLPLVVAATLLMAFGVAWPAALIGLWVPSVRLLIAQALRFAYFAAPGLVSLAEASPSVRHWIVFNPLTGLFESFRHVFLFGTSPPWWELAYPAAFGVLIAAVCIPLYRREQRHFAKLVGEE